jgi:FkbM family methyltransferase
MGAIRLLMKKIKNAITQFIEIFSLTFRSQFTTSEKLSLLRALIWCYFGVKLKIKKKVITLKLIGMQISSYGYFNLLHQLKEIFLLSEYQISTTNKSPVIIDCGANIGLSILYFKKKCPNSKIFAFEPNPNVFNLLKLNIEQNHLQGVELYNYCLSDSEGEIEFYVNENLGTMEGSVLEERGGANKLKVKAVRLSSYIKEEVDLVKMDIEGAEINVLDDLKRNGKLNSVNTYLIEFHHNIPGQLSGLGRFIQDFEENNFGVSLRSGFHNQGEFQDVFLRIFKKRNSY